MSITADLGRSLIAVASRAPSVHNTQPWSFRLVDGEFELWADVGRQLPVADPEGRELAISCGAALFTLRLAIRARGLEPEVELEPSPECPPLLARVRASCPRPAGPEERRLFEAVNRRHTHRGRFPGGPVSRALLVELQRIAEAEGALLFTVESPGRMRRIADFVAAADRTQRTAPAWRDELAEWTPAPGSDRRDGVPSYTYPASGVVTSVLPVRDFGLDRGWGNEDGPGTDDAVLTVLATAGDELHDWLRAGQALQAVLLRAAVDWAFAAVYTQPLELAYVRAQVAEELPAPAHPQMLLRLGYAGYAPTTPRRSSSEVLRS